MSNDKREQVIEAIAKVLKDYWQWEQTVNHGSYIMKPTKHVKDILSLTYPSGQPMIGMLAEDQTLPTYSVKTPKKKADRMAVADISFGYEMAQRDMAGWRKVLGGEK